MAQDKEHLQSKSVTQELDFPQSKDVIILQFSFSAFFLTE